MADTDLSKSQLETLCAALGWQGGTYWQVVDEVRRLKIDADKHPAVRAEPELLHLAEACETWALQVSQQADVRAGIRDAGARLARQLNAAIQRHLAGSAALPPPQPAFDASQPCILTTPDPTRTVCLRCKNPHHACDHPAYGIAAAVPHRESDSIGRDGQP